MKMAKASEADMKMALDLSQLLESLQQGYFPVEEGSDEESDPFNESRAADCQKAIELIFGVLERGSLFRVTFGMTVLLDPRNEVVDPSVDYLEHHPKTQMHDQLVAALKAGQKALTGNVTATEHGEAQTLIRLALVKAGVAA